MKAEARIRLGMPACYQRKLVERLQAADLGGACDAVEGLEQVLHSQRHIMWRERRAAKRALLRVETFLGDCNSYVQVRAAVAWLLEERALELFQSCARKLLCKGAEYARSGDEALGMQYRALAVTLVGEDEAFALAEECRLSFIPTPSFGPPATSRVRASFVR
ncbi:MAG TPA: hypothetical protein VFW90_02470 [Candidatus Saccharimonadales bacterium]|nr:hypothetical protein [Candidatus Saccharimonadales bacterium]